MERRQATSKTPFIYLALALCLGETNAAPLHPGHETTPAYATSAIANAGQTGKGETGKTSIHNTRLEDDQARPHFCRLMPHTANAILQKEASGEDAMLKPRADLKVSISDDSDPVAAGSPISYRISVSNRGPGVARHTALYAILAPHTRVLSIPGGCSVLATHIRCNLEDLAQGERHETAIHILATKRASVSFTVYATNAADDPGMTDNLATEETRILSD